MIHETFDKTTKPLLTPEAFYGRHEAVEEVCVITFSCEVRDWVLANMKCEKVAVIGSANGGYPIYMTEWKGKKVYFYMTLVTAPGAATCLEEARCLTGCKKYIIFGSCGSLDSSRTDGKMIVPTECYRDEGLSYHYVPASDYIGMRGWNQVADFMDRQQVPYVTGRTWTTDGIYRETAGKAERMRKDGCVCVEMELAGLQAVCEYHDLSLYAFLFSSDCLGEKEWHNDILGKPQEADVQTKCFLLAMDLAAELT